MKAFGRGHEAARELAAQHHSNNAGKLSSEEEDLANIRHKKALTRLRTEVSEPRTLVCIVPFLTRLWAAQPRRKGSERACAQSREGFSYGEAQGR